MALAIAVLAAGSPWLLGWPTAWTYDALVAGVFLGAALYIADCPHRLPKLHTRMAMSCAGFALLVLAAATRGACLFAVGAALAGLGWSALALRTVH